MGDNRNDNGHDHDTQVMVTPGEVPEPAVTASPAGPEAGPDQEPSRPALSAEDVAALQQERDDYYDRLLRTTAEFENYRRRVERERREQADHAAADVLRALLPIIDNLERALEAEAPPDAAPYRKGVEIIRGQMLELLRRQGVKAVEALGAPFDPHVHEAVVTEQTADVPDGQVIAEYQRGYRLGDRLLRPAMVKVAKA